MTNGHVVADDRGSSTWGGVQNALILDVRSCSDFNGKDIASKDGLKPDAGMLADLDVSNNIG